MATWWTIQIPPTLTDVTAEGSQQPAIKGKLAAIKQQGGTVDLHIYQAEDASTALLVLDASFGDMPQKLEVIEGFESGARKTSYGTGKELDYTTSRTDTFIIAKQHAVQSNNVEGW